MDTLKVLLCLILTFCQSANAFICIEEVARLYETRANIHLHSIKEAIELTQPAQHIIGIPRIIVFSEKLLNSSVNQIRRQLELRPIPYIKGPDGLRYITDRHHTLYTFNQILPELKDRGYPIANIKVKMVEQADYSGMSQEKFYKRMLAEGQMYPIQLNGAPNPHSLPKNIKDLKIGFYRGLSWLVRKSGAIENVDVPFYEFHWAKLLEDHFQFKKQKFTRKKIKKAIRYAIQQKGDHTEIAGYRPDSHQKEVDQYMEKLSPILEILKEAGVLSK